MDFIADAWRDICMFVDKILYWLISLLYQLFYYVANSEFLNSDIIQDIYSRVSILLGIFMLFALSFELIQMLVNPDAMNDKQGGLGKIITKIIISIVLLGMINPIFDEAFELQRIILKEDVPGKLITGVANKYNVSDVSVGIEFASTVFFAFVRDDNNPSLESVRVAGDSLSYQELKQSVIDEKDFNIVSRYINAKEEGSSSYVLEYSYIISGAVALFVIWLLINYIFSCAVRVVQLAFLRLIAPVPIMGNITKKGEDRFKKWVSQCVTTYVDLFIRLIIITFAMFLILALNENNAISGIEFATTSVQDFVKIIIIIGILMFAKKAPELLKELLPSGGAASGDFGLNLGKRFKDNFAGKALAFGAGALATGVVGATSGKGFGRVTGALGGLVRGGYSGLRGKKLNDSLAKQREIGSLQRNGVNWFDRQRQNIRNTFGLDDKTSSVASSVAFEKQIEDRATQQAYKYAGSNTSERTAFSFSGKTLYENVAVVKQIIDTAKQNGQDNFVVDGETFSLASADGLLKSAEKQARIDMINNNYTRGSDGKPFDEILEAQLDKFIRENPYKTESGITVGKHFEDTYSDHKVEQTRLETRKGYFKKK